MRIPHFIRNFKNSTNLKGEGLSIEEFTKFEMEYPLINSLIEMRIKSIVINSHFNLKEFANL